MTISYGSRYDIDGRRDAKTASQLVSTDGLHPTSLEKFQIATHLEFAKQEMVPRYGQSKSFE